MITPPAPITPADEATIDLANRFAAAFISWHTDTRFERALKTYGQGTPSPYWIALAQPVTRNALMILELTWRAAQEQRSRPHGD